LGKRPGHLFDDAAAPHHVREVRHGAR
jgi:hypothetical protein